MRAPGSGRGMLARRLMLDGHHGSDAAAWNSPGPGRARGIPDRPRCPRPDPDHRPTCNVNWIPGSLAPACRGGRCADGAPWAVRSGLGRGAGPGRRPARRRQTRQGAQGENGGQRANLTGLPRRANRHIPEIPGIGQITEPVVEGMRGPLARCVKGGVDGACAIRGRQTCAIRFEGARTSPLDVVSNQYLCMSNDRVRFRIPVSVTCRSAKTRHRERLRSSHVAFRA